MNTLTDIPGRSAGRRPRLAVLLWIAALWVVTACGGTATAGEGPLPVTGTPNVTLPTLTATPVRATATGTARPRPPATATVTLTATATAAPSQPATATVTPLSADALTATARPTAWPTPDHPLTPDERTLLFDELWRTINERYLYPDFNGVNWSAQYDPYLARALAAPNDDAYYTVLKELVDLLGDSHSRFMSPSEALDHFALTSNDLAYGGLGLYTMPLPDGALVLQVIPNSPAARAGVQACDRVTALDGGGYWGDGGVAGSSSLVEFYRPDVGPYSRSMTREEVTQVLSVPAEILPWPDKRIAYVRIDTLWVREAAQQMRDQLDRLSAGGPLDGLILDLRPNVGGWRPVLQSLLGSFLPAGQLGEFSGRIESEPLRVPREDDPPPAYLDLPMVGLVGPRTESYAEVLAGVLQAEGRATVLGQRTQGNVETIFPRRLPFGARVWIAEQGFELNNGVTLEGRGVLPDIYDDTDWTRYACGRDPQVARAVLLFDQ